MAVYVDDFRGAAWAKGFACHMMADSHDELEAMARRLRLSPSWIQHVGRMTEHYDLYPSKREMAIRFGAVEVDAREHMRALLDRREATS